MDGKHIQIKQPKNSGSYYFNYKGMFSIVLLALVDANYKFIYIDVGCNGRISDGGVYRNSSLSNAIDRNLLGIPPPRKIGDYLLPYVIVGDDAFPLKQNLMKPYPFRGLSKAKRVTNYRISRARRVSENVFGIMCNRFRAFLSAMQLSVGNVEKVTLASCVLHNFLRDKIASRYTPPGSFDIEDLENGVVNEGEWRNDSNDLRSIEFAGSNNCSFEAKRIRDDFCEYFNSEIGSVEWQDKFV